jgi:antitoxin Phd
MDTWKLQDAKARFSEVVERALASGPQVVTRHGANAVVVISYDEFVKSTPVEDFKSFLLSSRGVSDLPLTREKHLPRKNDFEVSP